MGNPHAILMIDMRCGPVHFGTLIESHERFPDRVNVGFMQILSTELKLRLYERGAGETRPGSGPVPQWFTVLGSACWTPPSRCNCPAETLGQWDSAEAPVWLGGPTASVFDGTISLRD